MGVSAGTRCKIRKRALALSLERERLLVKGNTVGGVDSFGISATDCSQLQIADNTVLKVWVAGFGWTEERA